MTARWFLIVFVGGALGMLSVTDVGIRPKSDCDAMAAAIVQRYKTRANVDAWCMSSGGWHE